MKKSNPRANPLRSKTILHILTGSIAAYKSGDLIKSLREQGARVICVLTEAAKHFVTPLVLRAISGEKVYQDFFATETPHNVLHANLAEQADLILVAPASADFIAKLAAGMADDLASCIILIARCPIVIVPAMNDLMYEHPVTQQNIKKLKDIGYHFIDPVIGRLVCGKEAIGHVADTSQIIHILRDLIKK